MKKFHLNLVFPTLITKNKRNHNKIRNIKELKITQNNFLNRNLSILKNLSKYKINRNTSSYFYSSSESKNNNPPNISIINNSNLGVVEPKKLREIYNNSRNSYTINVNKIKLKSFVFSQKNNKNGKMKKSCGVDTKDLFRIPKERRLNFKIINSKKSKILLSLKNMYQNLESSCKNKNNSMTDNKYGKDKYSYIYLNEKSESIKFFRRLNYNPLDV